MREEWRVLRAEWRRLWSAHPWSTFHASVLFPALTLCGLFLLPRLDLDVDLHVRRVAVTLEGVPRPQAELALAGLADQPLFDVVESPDARALYQRGEVEAAVLLRPGGEGELLAEVWRPDDLASAALVDGLERSHEGEVTPRLVALDAETQDEEQGRNHLASITIFVLIGFAWFYVTVGVVEGFVVERERRSLEGLLATPLDPVHLLRGRLLGICAHAMLPQLSAMGALLVLGLSGWALSLLPLLLGVLLPLALACFWIFRDTEDSLSAGWRTGLIFMVGFPLLILGSNVLGTLSPLFQLGRAVVEAPLPSFYLPALGGVFLLNLGAWWLSRAAAARWHL